MLALRHSDRDALFIALAAAHGALLVAVPSAPLIAILMWWNANTIAHNFIHLPYFRSRPANRAFSAYLSLLLGVPQTIWRDRHLAHHAGRPWRVRWSPRLALETGLVIALWAFLATRGIEFFLGTWVAGWAGGLVLCTLQGHYEHARGTVSHYGTVYNVAFFNDGYHVEHHARPDLHWSELPAAYEPGATRSRWPAALQWLELLNLTALEKIALRSGAIRGFMVRTHRRAFAELLATLPPTRRIIIIGGGLFPRTAIVLRALVPDADITIIDRSAEHLSRARAFLDERVRVIEASYTPETCTGADLVVLPLAFDGDRDAVYRQPPAAAVAIHDWIWRRRGTGVIVSWFLLKRVNLARALHR